MKSNDLPNSKSFTKQQIDLSKSFVRNLGDYWAIQTCTDYCVLDAKCHDHRFLLDKLLQWRWKWCRRCSYGTNERRCWHDYWDWWRNCTNIFLMRTLLSLRRWVRSPKWRLNPRIGLCYPQWSDTCRQKRSFCCSSFREFFHPSSSFTEESQFPTEIFNSLLSVRINATFSLLPFLSRPFWCK